MTTTLVSSGKISAPEIAKRTWAEIRAADVFGRAAQLAYYFFLALFPFLICVVASLSVFGRADRGRALLAELFTRILPATAYQLIDKTVAEIIQSSGPLKMSLGILVSLWSASMGVNAIMDTLNATYKVKETRSLIAQYATAVALTIGLTLLAVVSVLIVVLGDQLVGAFAPGNIVTSAWRIAQWALALGVLLLALAITYHFAPDVKNRKWQWVTPGSLAGVFLLVMVCVGVRIYFHYAGNYSVVYGSLGAVIVLLVCFYLGGVAILSGGALNGVLESLAAEKKPSQVTILKFPA
ncbi:MAG: YihY/virulence factor BrkB family protein [Candidatus Sulfotelmatobacter sp.]